MVKVDVIGKYSMPMGSAHRVHNESERSIVIVTTNEKEKKKKREEKKKFC